MFTVCPFDAKRQELRLVTTPSRGFAGLSSERVSFGMNAGMFDESGAPVGLLVEDGRTVHNLNTARGSGNFYMQPNGVFSQDQDGRLHVETTQAFAARHPKPRWAMQSGPMLLIAGKLHPLISDDGPSRYVRNGVCLKVPERALFAISEGAVSFGRFAHFFRDALGCRDALYFDGFVSSLWLPSQGRLDHRAPLGPLIVVTDR
jgi:uncharacterized protein YigE (DUF2233 family)